MREAAVRVGVDLGKTGCRAVDEHGRTAEGPGAPGLADPGGAQAAYTAIVRVIDELTTTPAVIVIGSAGAESGGRPGLAELLASRYPTARIAITGDAVTAHAGALQGEPGVVVAIGTGSVAVGVSGAGEVVRLGGWGPWLGDEGSGGWIGHRGIAAVISAHEGRGPATQLTEAAVDRFGPLRGLPSRVHGEGGVARTLASFAPDVLAAAEAGDTVARRICDEAVAEWVSLAVGTAAAVGESRVALVGGLAHAERMQAAFAAALPAGLEVVPSQGTSAEGALLLATRTDLPHESALVRHAPAGTPMAGGDGPVGQGDVDRLATEQVRADLTDLDLRTPAEVVTELIAGQAPVPGAVAAATEALVRAVALATTAITGGGRIIYVGAGTPGRLAAQDAAECPPTFGIDPSRVVALLAGGAGAARTAVEGAEDDASAAEADLAGLAPGPADVVVGITASGRTPYVVAALDAARRAGAATVGVVNNLRSPVAEVAEVCVELLTGPEVVSGSTRLAAGTAQKIALNAISTGAMICAGKTYGPWMVDLRATNEKLRRRARRILREAAGVDDATAEAALRSSGGEVKPALVALLAGVDAGAAATALEAAGGYVRTAVEALGARPLP